MKHHLEPLSQLLDGDLHDEEAAQMRKRLSEDPQLLAHWEVMQDLPDLLSSLEAVEPPAALNLTVMNTPVAANNTAWYQRFLAMEVLVAVFAALIITGVIKVADMMAVTEREESPATTPLDDLEEEEDFPPPQDVDNVSEAPGDVALTPSESSEGPRSAPLDRRMSDSDVGDTDVAASMALTTITIEDGTPFTAAEVTCPSVGYRDRGSFVGYRAVLENVPPTDNPCTVYFKGNSPAKAQIYAGMNIRCKFWGGQAICTPSVPSPTPVAPRIFEAAPVTIYHSLAKLRSVAISCKDSGFRRSASADDGEAKFHNVPVNDYCRVFFKGGPVGYTTINGGDSVYCEFKDAFYDCVPATGVPSD
jgi:hypothetical protein